MNPWLTFCVLICEDLARQDPVADLMRTVGPNLVVALLLDGPQLLPRWPARYATVLADDPGSSVLTVTSLGMALMCKSPGKQASRAIGLWKDARSGQATEIVLPVDASGAVLSLNREYAEEWTADARSDGNCASYLSLGGIHYV